MQSDSYLSHFALDTINGCDTKLFGVLNMNEDEKFVRGMFSNAICETTASGRHSIIIDGDLVSIGYSSEDKAWEYARKILSNKFVKALEF